MLLSDFLRFRSALLTSAATGLALAVMPVHSYAQDTDVEAVEEDQGDDSDEERMVVTGIRAAIESSLDAKRENTSIVEAITAEDIGKLPDLSIADSLARLPGVTAQRVRGRAQQISIRGLGPDFSLALINGREVVSAGNNRGIEFDQFPSELIAQGLVYKTPDARLAATGIAGAVDLRTIRPLDFSESQINVSGRYVFNDQDQLNPDFDKDGYRFFGSYIDQNDAGTLGWSFGVTVQSNPTQYTSRELKTDTGQTATDPVTGLRYPSDNPRTGVVSREFERMSAAGALQFEPTENFSATLDVLYSETEDSGIFRGVETPLATWAGVPGPSAISGNAGNGFASRVTYDGVAPILRTDTEGNESDLFAIGLNASYRAFDRLTLTADIAHSSLDRNDIDYESYAGRGGVIVGSGRDAALVDQLTYKLDGDGEYSIDSSADYTDPNQVFLTDPGGWGQVGFIKEPEITDELTQLRAEAEYETDFPFIASVVGGYLYTDREKDFDSNEAFLRNNDTWQQIAGSTDNRTRFLPIPSVVGKTDAGSIGLPIIAYDPERLLSNGAYTIEKATFDTEWNVAEEIHTFYAMANIDGALFDIPVRGNVGFQYADTTQSSTGTLAGGGLQTVEYSYDDFLPSLNLSFEVFDSTFLRIGASRTVTRARLDELAANQSINLNPLVCSDIDGDQRPDIVTDALNPRQGLTCYTLSGGNPLLEPYRSTAIDVALEKYFNETTAVAIAFFHKDLSDWIVDLGTIVDGSQQIRAIGEGDFLAANPQISRTRLSGPVNFLDGSITGVEVTVQADFDQYLPDYLAGFGAFASYTYADNGLDLPDGGSFPIPGYSESVWSANIYYENYGFRARLSARHRSDFESEVQNFDGSLSLSTALEETILDAQIGYEWEEGPLAGFTVLFEAFNLTDEPFTTIGRGTGFPTRFEEYGTTYNIAVSKRF